MLRRDVLFIRIGKKNYPSYLKASQQYNSGRLPPVIDTCYISRMILQSITLNISDCICLNDCINSDRLKRSDVHINKVTDISISTISLIGNSPVLSSKYPFFEFLSIETSDLKNNPFRVIKLKKIMREGTNVLEDNDVNMGIICWGGRI